MTANLRRIVLVGVLFAALAAAVATNLLVLPWLDSRDPRMAARRIAAEQAQRDRDATRREEVVAAKAAILKTGAFTRIDCETHEAQADGPAWVMSTLETKRRAVDVLSGICQAETGYRRITIIDDRSGRKLAEYSGYSATEFY